MWKVFAILSLILIITVVVLILIIKYKNKDIASFKSENETLRTIYEELNNSYTNLTKEMEIDKNISCMSIDDVMHQLQDNNSNRKDNL